MEKTPKRILETLRCNNCNKRLVDAKFIGALHIKCPRCKTLNIISK